MRRETREAQMLFVGECVRYVMPAPLTLKSNTLLLRSKFASNSEIDVRLIHLAQLLLDPWTSWGVLTVS